MASRTDIKWLPHVHWLPIRSRERFPNRKMTAIVGAEGLTKVYPPSMRAVDGITFSAEEGEVYCGVTPRGLEFLDTYFRMKGFLEEFCGE